MSKLTYYPTMFHTNPFSFNMIELWDHSGNDARELVLRNGKAKEIGVSKMELNIIMFSVLDKNGNEHFQNDFTNHVELNSKGMDTEFFIGTKSKLKLDRGTYTTFRFYLGDSGNRFIYTDRSKEVISQANYIEFEIKNDLVVNSTEDLQVAMRFDFEPFSLKSYFRSLKSIFNGSKRPQAGKLVNC